MIRKPPNAPTGLGPRGSGLWAEILRAYRLDSGELLLLESLCRTVDRIDALDAELASQGLTVTGKRGQLPKASPLLLEIREERKLLSKLVAEIALPIAGVETVGKRRTPAQRQAAKSG